VGEVGERDRARRLLALARELKPGSPAVWVSLADGWARIDDVDQATRDLRRAGPESSWGPGAWRVQGRIMTARGNHRDAVAAWNKVVEAEPGECEPRFFRGLALMLVGDPEGAEADFEACLSQVNRGPQIRGALAYARFDQSRLDEAEKAFREALEADPDSADNHLGLALVRLRQGDPEAAVAGWREVLRREPAFAAGLKAVARKGYIYSEIQKRAFEDLMRAVPKGRGGRR
jgi:tetratricopeptide (TPR) repeat protein